MIPSQPCAAHLGHEGPALRGVDDLGHVLPGDVEDLGVVVLVEEPLDLGDEGELLGRELEVHAAASCLYRARARLSGAGADQFLTGRQIVSATIAAVPGAPGSGEPWGDREPGGS